MTKEERANIRQNAYLDGLKDGMEYQENRIFEVIKKLPIRYAEQLIDVIKIGLNNDKTIH